MRLKERRRWARLLAARGLTPSRIAFVLDEDETTIAADLSPLDRLGRKKRRAWLPVDRWGRCKNRRITGQTGRRIRRLATLGYDAEWIATTLELEPDAVADFLRRLKPVRKTELARPRGPSEEARLCANQAAAAAREARRRVLTPPAGWSHGDRLATGEAREWAGFMTALREARASGTEILGLASRVWFAPPRSRPDAPVVEPAIWTGAESPHAGNPKLTPEMIAEIIALRLQGWSTGKLARRYAVSRATICYAFSRRTFRELQLPPTPLFVPDPLARPGHTSPTPPQEQLPRPGRTAAERDEPSHRFPPEAGWANGDHNATGEDREWKHFLATKANACDLPAHTVPVIVTPFPFEPAVWTGPTDDEDDAPRNRGWAY